MTYIDLGLIDGNSFGAVQLDLLEAAINKGVLAAEVRLYVGAAEPLGWLFLNGQVVINFQGLYPDAWAQIPASWKSGSNANLPNMAGRFPTGQDGSHVLGTAGSANTHTLTTANLASHTHPIDHDHPLETFSGITTQAYDQFNFAGSVPAHHAHGPGTGGGANYFVTNGGGSPANVAVGTGFAANPATNFAGGDHIHRFSLNVDLANLAGTSGPTGSGTAVDHTPAWVAFNFILKVH